MHSYTAYIVGLCVLSLLDQDIRRKTWQRNWSLTSVHRIWTINMNVTSILSIHEVIAIALSETNKKVKAFKHICYEFWQHEIDLDFTLYWGFLLIHNKKSELLRILVAINFWKNEKNIDSIINLLFWWDFIIIFRYQLALQNITKIML